MYFTPFTFTRKMSFYWSSFEISHEEVEQTSADNLDTPQPEASPQTTTEHSNILKQVCLAVAYGSLEFMTFSPHVGSVNKSYTIEGMVRIKSKTHIAEMETHGKQTCWKNLGIVPAEGALPLTITSHSTDNTNRNLECQAQALTFICSSPTDDNLVFSSKSRIH